MCRFLPEHVSWENWGAMYTDLELWRPAVVHVWKNAPQLVGQSEGIQSLRIEPVFPGTCAVFVVNKTAVVKFFPPFARKDFDRELHCLTHLPGGVSHIPQLIASGELQDRVAWPYLVIRFEPGAAWREVRAGLAKRQREIVAGQLGHAIGELHSQPVASGAHWPRRADRQELVSERTQASPDELAQYTSLPVTVIGEVRQLMRTYSWFAQEPCLVHADLTEDHALLAEEDGQWRLSCVIDWADAEVATPAYDWVALWFSFCDRDASLLRAFLAGYSGSSSVDWLFVDDLLAHTFVHRFGPRIIADVLSPEEQASCGSLHHLRRLLFQGLG